MARNRVDLPAPLVPSRATISPRCTARSMPKRICTGPYDASTPLQANERCVRPRGGDGGGLELDRRGVVLRASVGSRVSPAGDGGHIEAADAGPPRASRISRPISMSCPKPPGNDHEDEQHAGTGDQVLVLGQSIGGDLDQGHADQRAGDRPQSTDDGHGEDEQAQAGVEGALADRAKRGDVQRAGNTGDGPGEHEGAERGAHGGHGHGRRRFGVVPHGQQHPARPSLAQTDHEEHDGRPVWPGTGSRATCR